MNNIKTKTLWDNSKITGESVLADIHAAKKYINNHTGIFLPGYNSILPYGMIQIKKIITSKNTGQWCQIPYPNHPKGCPNYGCDGCPPDALPIAEVLDLRRSVYIAFSQFNLQAHMKRMKLKHPKWSERQLRNVLYWQGTSRKQMRERARLVQYLTRADTVLTCPEAHGVNVYTTCFVSGLHLQKIRYLTTCRHIALIGFSHRGGK